MVFYHPSINFHKAWRAGIFEPRVCRIVSGNMIKLLFPSFLKLFRNNRRRVARIKDRKVARLKERSREGFFHYGIHVEKKRLGAAASLRESAIFKE